MPQIRPASGHRRRLLRQALCCALFGLAGSALAMDADIEEHARRFLDERLAGQGLQGSIELHAPTARWPACPQPEIFLPHPERRLLGRVALGVRCADGQTRYLQAQVSVQGQHVVAARPIAAGETLSADMLELREGPLEKLPRHAVTDPASILGLQATRPLEAGSLLQSHLLRAERLVRRNARVRIEAVGNGFRISREGTALDHGSQGETIRVRTESGEILRARVTGRNRLQIDL